MGVCKCKQRNVTNQFCYVCRMNVCESCIVKDHPRCIIKSYVNWLQDSDYSETCSLCCESVKTGELIRLTCYDLFHWDCFNKWALKFPEGSNPSTYQCPDCKTSVFPRAALVSPVADVIRQRFATVAWGRRGLGMKPVKQQKDAVAEARAVTPELLEHNVQTSTSTPKSSYKPPANTIKSPPPSSIVYNKQAQPMPASYTREKYEGSTTVRKLVATAKHEEAKIDVPFDHDDNKYKRKGFTHWFGNMLRLTTKPSKVDPNATLKRVLFALTLFALLFMTVVYFMSKLGRGFALNDPMLDPDLNPNIRVRPDLTN